MDSAKTARREKRRRKLAIAFESFLSSSADDEECLMTVAFQSMTMFRDIFAKVEQKRAVEVKKRQLNTCPICIEEFDGRQVTVLECGHKFHQTCNNSWMRSCRTCALCRQKVEKDPFNPCKGCVGYVMKMSLNSLKKGMKMEESVFHDRIHKEIFHHYLYFCTK
jgi:hypothetical protein